MSFMLVGVVIIGFTLFVSAMTRSLHNHLLNSSIEQERFANLNGLKYVSRHAVGRAKERVYESTDPAIALNEYQVAQQEISTYIDSIRAISTGADELTDFRDLKYLSDQLRSIEMSAFSAYESGSVTQARTLLGNDFEPDRSAFADVLDRLIAQSNNRLGAVVSAVRTISLSIQVVTMLMLIIVLLFITAIYWSIKRSVIASIVELANLTKQFTSGNLGVRSSLRSKDEVGELAQAFNAMGEQIERSTKQLKAGKASLEQEVYHRTQELQAKLQELERFNRLTIGRELKMRELKKQIQSLEAELHHSKSKHSRSKR